MKKKPAKALAEENKPPCNHVYDHVAIGNGPCGFNVYRCRYCGDEDWI